MVTCPNCGHKFSLKKQKEELLELIEEQNERMREWARKVRDRSKEWY